MSIQGPLPTLTVPAAASDTDVGTAKKFACSWQGCGKSFSRSEHLHRHELNHKEGDNTCLRCATHFRRRDLLDRHLLRHKEKDDEAGGEGLGHLATRKRLWRDASGNIVNARRPYRQEGVKRQQLSSSKGSVAGNTRQENSLESGIEEVSSTPISVIYTENRHVEQYGGQSLLPDTWEGEKSQAPPPWINDSSDFLRNADWGSQQYQGVIEPSFDLPYDNIFKPDTAMSFNAPFTTLSYYSWLFENENLNKNETTMIAIPSQSEHLSLTEKTPNIPQEKAYCVGTSMQIQDGLERGNYASNMSISLDPRISSQLAPLMLPNMQPSQGPVDPLSQHHQYSAIPFNGSHVSPNICLTRTENTVCQNSGEFECSPSTSVDSEGTDPNSTNTTQSVPPSTSLSFYDGPSSAQSYSSQTSNTRDQIPGLNNKNLPDAYTTTPGSKLPLITADARDRLLQEISQSHPTRPDGSEIILSDPLLSQSSLQHYSDLFFARFNSSYPLIHQPTFDSNNVHNFLLMAILLLGATYSDKEAHLLAVCIHDIMRPLIHSSKEFSTKPKLWMLQTILLVECFGKSRAGEKQHDMSHLYHGLLINLIRKSDCQSAYVPPFDAESHNLECHWRLSVEAEQKRRLAMLCFMWDTQHAVLFCQSLCMNASELKLTLPWDNAVWEAQNADEWLRLCQNAPSPPYYLTILKMYTNPATTKTPPQLNALSRVLIFHGLMSISWDLNRRDQTSLSLSITSSSIPWQIRMSKCYEKWKTDFEIYSSAVLISLAFDPKQKAKFLRFSVANMAVYHTAQLILEVEIIDLQIYAGARHIIGRPVADSDRFRSKTKIKEWMTRERGKSAANAIWHAARLFRDGVRKLENWNVDEMFHYPWCLYLATLVCWAYSNAAVEMNSPCSPAPEKLTTGVRAAEPEFATSSLPLDDRFDGFPTHVEDLDDEDIDWDSHAEMIALISGLTKLDPKKDAFLKDIWVAGRRHKTQGLLRCMVKQLSTIRWAVVREGMIVLRGLIC